MCFEIPEGSRLPPAKRDSVRGVRAEAASAPAIVSISDIHGYLDRARSALLTLTDHPDYDPVVVDEDGTVHWAGGNYVLVFNGDLVDRGPANEAVLELVSRLGAQAPAGRVRVTLGNHEAIVLSPDQFGFRDWYSGRVSSEARRAFLRRILSGHVVAAYQGYNVTYAHAGTPEPYDVETVNESLRDAAAELLAAVDSTDDAATQRRVLEEYETVLGVGSGHLKGPGAGLVWLDFEHLPADAPPQVVGHTRHTTPEQKGNVYCQNVIRDNLDSPGGEAVFVETRHSLSALARRPDGDVSHTRLIDPS